MDLLTYLRKCVDRFPNDHRLTESLKDNVIQTMTPLIVSNESHLSDFNTPIWTAAERKLAHRILAVLGINSKTVQRDAGMGRVAFKPVNETQIAEIIAYGVPGRREMRRLAILPRSYQCCVCGGELTQFTAMVSGRHSGIHCDDCIQADEEINDNRWDPIMG